MRRPPAAACGRSLAAISSFCLFIVAAADGDPAARPLTNEDIVRLVVNGTEERVILEEIATRPIDFDLDDDVVVELRLVGVSDGIIEAMRERQREIMQPAGDAASPDSLVAGPAGFVVIELLSSGEDETSSPFAILAVPEGVKRSPGMEVGLVSDLALAVLCTTSDHVPDHWDVRSPIEQAPRHGLVFFQPASRPDKVKKFEVLRLALTTTPPLSLPVGSHRLIVALAGRSAGSGAWHLLASDPVTVEVEEAQTLTLRLSASSRLLGNRMTGYSVEQEWKIARPGAGEREE